MRRFAILGALTLSLSGCYAITVGQRPDRPPDRRVMGATFLWGIVSGGVHSGPAQAVTVMRDPLDYLIELLTAGIFCPMTVHIWDAAPPPPSAWSGGQQQQQQQQQVVIIPQAPPQPVYHPPPQQPQPAYQQGRPQGKLPPWCVYCGASVDPSVTRFCPACGRER